MTWGYNAAFRGHCCFYSFFKGPFDMQIWADLTKISEEWTSCFRNNWVDNTVISSWILLITCVFIHVHRFQSKTKYSPITNCFSNAAQLRQPIENSLVLCHLKTSRLYTGPFMFELDHYLTNVARVKRTYWGWPILFINWSHDVSVTWYS